MEKKKYLKLAGLLSLLTLSACNQDINDFTPEKGNFIYFDMPFKLDIYGDPIPERNMALSYSFDLDDSSVTSHIFKVPINIIGLAETYDRQYSVEVIAEKTTATDTDWDKSSTNNLTIKTGELRDSIYIKVNRTEILKTEERTIFLKIVPNENFQAGYSNLLEMSITFTDQLSPPVWWNKWSYAFGEYSREKFNKWKEIYYLGADPNLEDSGPNAGKPLYWDNMPYYTTNTATWYPSTAMYIRTLRQYFIDNEVYPDGDRNKPRISIPYKG